MIKKIGTFALFILSLSAFAQTEPTAPATAPAATQPARRYSRPDIPGTFMLEIGVNTALNKPPNFKTGFWGSRTLNIYYMYDMRIAKSKFTFVPGIGFSCERYKFTNGYTLRYDDNDSLKMVSPTEVGLNVKKSQLIANYLEVPIELKFSTRPNDPNRSFKASLGFRVGYMIDSHTKLKYREDSETKKFKDNQNFNLTRFRYGVYTRMGAGNMAVFCYYNLTPLFEEGKGIAIKGGKTADELSTFTIGFSFASF